MKETAVTLSRLAVSDRRYRFSRGGSLDGLTASIRTVGLIDPPDLHRIGRRLHVIRGARRIAALRSLGRRSVTARIHDEGELTSLDAWKMNFFDTIARRPLNAAEGCTALHQLQALGCPLETLSLEYLPLTGLPAAPGALDGYCAVAGLGEAVLDSLARSEFTLATALFLASLEGADRRAARRFLAKRPLTVSQQREWVRLTGDVAALEHRSVAALLTSVARAARSLSGQPGQRALQVLRERRYPALSERKRAFAAAVTPYRLPPWFHLDPHPFFERDELTVRFSVSDREAWRQALRLLTRIDADGRLLPPHRRKGRTGT